MRKRVLLLADMNSRWTFQYLKKAHSNHLEITVIDYASSKLPFGEEYYNFCDENGIKVISIYNDGSYSRCLKHAAIINQMEEFDVCHIMYVNSEASLLVRMCEHKFHQIIANFWGSDFYRTTRKAEFEQKYVLDIADAIVVPEDGMKEKFVLKYPQFKDRIYTIDFDAPTAKLMQAEDSIEQYNCPIQLPEDKIVIAVGYNGTSQQQHELFIKALNRCSQDVKEQVFVIFSMTYGLQAEYEKYIQKLLENVEFPYVIIKEYMSNEQIVSLRRRIDIFVNAMITDAFNAAIQESMLCKSVILVGSWLYYKDIEEEQAYVNKFGDEIDLADKLSDIIGKFSDYKEKSEKNREIIKRIWEQREHVEDWIDLYDFTTVAHNSGETFSVWEYVLEQERKQSCRRKLYYEVMQNWLKKKLKNIEPISRYISCEKYKNIVIYGAGILGELVYYEIKDLEIVINVCDQNVTKVDWLDKKIIKLSELEKISIDCVIITPIYLYDEIVKGLADIGVKQMISLADILN